MLPVRHFAVRVVALYGAYAYYAADVNLDSSALKDAAVDCSILIGIYAY